MYRINDYFHIGKRFCYVSDRMLRHHIYETKLGRQVFLIPGDICVVRKNIAPVLHKF
jgi:hypothetical protein